MGVEIFARATEIFHLKGEVERLQLESKRGNALSVLTLVTVECKLVE